MYLELAISSIFNLIIITNTQYFKYDTDLIPDYNFISVKGRKEDLRGYFLEKKRKSRENDKKIQLLEQYVSNDTIYLDEIAHIKVDKKHMLWEKINKIEKEFRSLLAMNGVKYIYKRDTRWRTWREVLHPNGSKIIICYICENSGNMSVNWMPCGGFWSIEEKPPPCPYEMFSLVDNDTLCTVNYTQFKRVDDDCPSKITFTDLSGICENPIRTEWKINRIYNVSERSIDVICGGRENCDISTLYQIYPNFVVFRIINSTNDIIYSRIMKTGQINYVCVEDCGRVDQETLKVTKNDKPLIVNLYKSHKNKREYNFNKLNLQKTRFKIFPTDDLKNNNLKQPIDVKENEHKYAVHTEVMPAIKFESVDLEDFEEDNHILEIDSSQKWETTTMSHCKKIMIKEFGTMEYD